MVVWSKKGVNAQIPHIRGLIKFLENPCLCNQNQNHDVSGWGRFISFKAVFTSSNISISCSLISSPELVSCRFGGISLHYIIRKCCSLSFPSFCSWRLIFIHSFTVALTTWPDFLTSDQLAMMCIDMPNMLFFSLLRICV